MDNLLGGREEIPLGGGHSTTARMVISTSIAGQFHAILIVMSAMIFQLSTSGESSLQAGH
ncbi:hypothetical protein KBX06_05140 [Micromonospora sp. C31]|uniref:hypothetical protein n=1 Tax=Micromonospora sp. C31 TaxID=2824876 RepID=UPI001B38BC43|nr:hypothetical protein [Micromonospora sp. C31]MBQ1072556.1 hypothetical protein [Micromonospora sp. C31]